MEPLPGTFPPADTEVLLGLAKRGCRTALGTLLARYRRRLSVLVAFRVGRRLREKLDVDDLLQEVSLEAHQQIRRFQGDTKREFLCWLRKVLTTTVSNQVRHYFGTRKRDPRRERSIPLGTEGSWTSDGNLIAPYSSPSQRASRSERATILAEALRGLPASYREVIVLRQIEGESFTEVARRMGRTEDSVRNLWIRALARLRTELEGCHDLGGGWLSRCHRSRGMRTPGSGSDPDSEPGCASSVEALEHYLAALQEGHRPSREAFMAEHPDLSDDLARCLDVLEFIQSAAGGATPGPQSSPSDDALPPDTILGDYRLIREAGRGGMGIVYEAEQVPLARRVALKVLPFVAALDAKLVQRFRIEAQLAAQLNHPHIVPVYAVGSERGFHYYAMRFIEGQSLAAVIRERQRLERPSVEPPSAPRARIFARAVASIGLQAAEALEHAHSLGVLHRDIKPGNLLLDETGSLWVADFGLARLRDDPGPTQTGDLLGTLRYMSPEQVLARRGVVDQRSDVYSLGVSLYEALTLRPAFDGKDQQALLQQVLFDEPTPPRRIDPTIPKALETVILKAMTKEPAGRYATSAEFADDLGRFLADTPVLARPQSVVDRTVKWARRHRTPMMAAATALVLALTVASALLWHERNQTAAALDETRRTLDRESRAMDVIVVGAHTLTMGAMASMTHNMTPAQEQAAQPFLHQALSFYDTVSRIPGDDLHRRETKAKAWFGIGLTRWLLKRPDAEEAYRQSIALYDRLLAEAPSPQLRLQQLASLKFLAIVIHNRRGLDKAEPVFLDLLARERALAASAPSDPSFRTYLTNDLTAWGEMLKAAGRSEEAQRAFQEARGTAASKID